MCPLFLLFTLKRLLQLSFYSVIQYSQESASFYDMNNQREFILFKVSNTKARTECKFVTIEASERRYQSRCQASLLALYKFHFYFFEFSCWLGHVPGYRNVIRTLETSMNLIVQSNNSKIRAENVKSDFKIKM